MVTVLEVATRVGREVVIGFTSPVSAPPPLGAVGGILGMRRVRPAPAHVVNAATDYASGLVCPLLLPESLPMFIDDRLLDDDDLVHTATGERHTALTLRALDLLALLPGKMVDLRAKGSREAVARRH
ncbi:YbaK/EbsC family protein [Nonomuraea sp. NPDC049400]|uniref:YbaK/EbsC family protein n=1 Tax=Nonomuraea sp. NPDC049400 TaxID=3364352 RepID=UPI0037B917D8